MYLTRIFRSASRFRCRSQTSETYRKCILLQSPRDFSNNQMLCAKLFMEHENKYAYNIMLNKGITVNIESKKEYETLDTDTFQTLLKQDWSNKPSSEIYEAFHKFGVYCTHNNLCISNTIFDHFIDNLTDSLSKASDQELISVFYAFNQWPETPSIRTRNFIEVWVALDDTCSTRLFNWSHHEMLTFVSLFYMLNVTKKSDSTMKMLNKLANKAKKLAPDELVRTLFFVGVMRTPPFNMHNLEVQLEKEFCKYSLDDLAIMSMGFFKSKTPIRSNLLLMNIIQKLIDNAKNIHEVSLAALLKIVRYSLKVPFDDALSLIHKLFDTLQDEIPRLSIMCNVHIALLGTNKLLLHEGCFDKIADVVSNNLSKTRLKDLERLVLSYGTFRYTPQTDKNLFQSIMDELRKIDREEEINFHGRSFACCVQYLGLMGFYPVDLINKVLNPVFLKNTYGKHYYLYGREILTINNVAQIFCDKQNVNFLSEKETKLLSKKYTDYVPSNDYEKQYNVSEKMFLDIMQVLAKIRGGVDFVTANHILTHHQRGDIILCNTPDGTKVSVSDKFTSNTFGLIQRPPDSNIWIVLVVAGRNGIINRIKTPTGQFHAKIKELNHLGYHANLIPWNVYSSLDTFEEKEKYLISCIEEAIKVA